MRSLSLTLLALALLGGMTACGDDDENFDYQTHRVVRGPLRISIKQKGTIEARDPFHVINPLEGKSVINDIVPEGTMVEEGQQLFELDVADAREKVLEQSVQTEDAQQSYILAEEELKIQENQNESDIKAAELKVLFAELDIRQYVEGQLPLDIKDVESKITLSKMEFVIAQNNLKWSKELHAKGYISSEQLKGDELRKLSQEISKDSSETQKTLLIEFTAKKQTKQFEANLDEARRELERTKAKARAAYNQKKSDVDSRKKRHGLEVKQLERLQKLVENNIIYAPRAGMVVYGREGRGRESKPLEPGSSVREGQMIVAIPDKDKVIVDVDVHESMVHLVRLGMPVIVTTDMGVTIQGAIETVSSIPDSQSWYRNPDLKVYSTKVTVENRDGSFKPGMNCAAEIVIDELDDVLSIPVQAVHSNGEKEFTYVKSGGSIELREITVGLHNGRMIAVKGGLEEGDEVYLAVPDDADPIPMRQTDDAPTPLVKAPPVTTGGEKPSGSRGGARRGGGGGPRRMTDEMRKSMMEKMTPEQREKFEKMRKQRGNRGEGGGGGRSGRGGRRGEGQ